MVCLHIIKQNGLRARLPSAVTFLTALITQIRERQLLKEVLLEGADFLFVRFRLPPYPISCPHRAVIPFLNGTSRCPGLGFAIPLSSASSLVQRGLRFAKRLGYDAARRDAPVRVR